MGDARWIYAFGGGHADGSLSMKALLGGKGAGLAEMTNLGLPVPPGFTITTAACTSFFRNEEQWPAGLDAELQEALVQLEERAGKRFGARRDPLLVSVRSGSAVSMPGMMDTVLNLGLNDATVKGLARRSGDPLFAWDSYCRFIQMFGDVVLGIHYTRFAREESAFRAEHGEGELGVEDLGHLAQRLKRVVVASGRPFPEDPQEQLRLAINAVFNSYNTHRARYYRKTHGIPDEAGTGVTVQAMVFGNMGEVSGTGVAFTRNPKSGKPGVFGEWLPNVQGEDVVAGLRNPYPIEKRADSEGTGLQEAMPEAYANLRTMGQQLESHFRDMQDIEFTIERGTLYMLQTRTGKRSAMAAIRIAVDMVREGLITEEEALSRVDPTDLELVLRPVIAPNAEREVIAKGLDASPGAACGRVVFQSGDCQEFFDRDEPTILVRLETSPEDIQGMTIAQGILTARGGQTSHAAVVARAMGKPCVVGCTDIQVDHDREVFTAGDQVLHKGDWITIDGGTGEVMRGRVEMLLPETESGTVAQLLSWADARARLEVRANADTGGEAARARQLGAIGVGLCRTEHMFFRRDALQAMRRVILAEEPRSRKAALQDILPIQRAMFEDLFRAMEGLPVTIRLLDPPLHEFLPTGDEAIAEVAEEMGLPAEALHARLQQLKETNPMLGHRGARVGVTAPQVYRMQVRAIFEAACALAGEGVAVRPEVMIPLVAMPEELAYLRRLVAKTADQVIAESGERPEYLIGTMIEVPRAALLADRVALHADFFSYGTNDLTQMTYGFSPDDMGRFFPEYQRQGLLPDNPLTVFDIDGVGQLVQVAAERGRGTNPNLKLGVCGAHGGDPRGVGFFHRIGIDYVSCSPYRVPVARLAAAHAALGLL
jgi:pyruvate,orthophosphate dikinase